VPRTAGRHALALPFTRGVSRSTVVVVPVGAAGTLPLAVTGHSAQVVVSVVATVAPVGAGSVGAGSQPSSSPSTTPPTDAPSSADPSAPAGGPWRLAFDDEFSGTALNQNVWTTTYPWGSHYNHGNNEAQCYEPGGVTEGGGVLTLTARRAATSCDGITQPWSSGMVQSNGGYDFTYGWFEVRAKIPAGHGFWPAFWALPSDHSWPPEIDVMESWGGSSVPGVNTSYRATYHDPSRGQIGVGVDAADLTNTWHTYAADWEPGSLTFYFDGRAVLKTVSQVSSQPMYLLANLALDGTDDLTGLPSPARMAIDWVRVWQHG
jgi:beta-glucanase (GH16 family)